MKKIFKIMMVALICFVSTVVSAQTLKEGSSGTQVKILQLNLNGLSYNLGTPDGIFGKNTKNALIRYQRANGLVADGIGGHKTLTKLSNDVLDIQKKLKKLGYMNTAADGIYAHKTKDAVKRFQKDYSLVSDAIAGEKTISKLNQVSNTNKISSFSKTASDVVTYSMSRDGAKKISDNFTVSEFKCNDGSDIIKIDTKLVALVQEIRNHFNKPVIISSAYRTKDYNERVGGTSSSLHLYGKAADIKVESVKPLEVARYAQSLGVKGIGLYSSFVHVDTRQTKYYWKVSNSKYSQVNGF